MKNIQHKILVVDDVKSNQIVVSKILELVGYKVDTASDGLTALRLVKERGYDLILLDIAMPVMGGIETCRYLKADKYTADIPVIFLTASDDQQSLIKSFNAGGVDYLTKPFFKEELLARVSIHLKLRDHEINLENKVIEKTQEISNTQVQLMYTLGSIAEGHSKETQLHVQRVAEFAYLLAKLHGMGESEAMRVKNASTLHDIGKLGISSNILHKNGAVSNSEFKIIKKHPTIGAEMLSHSSLPLFKTAAIISKQHHEKWDGSGYPDKLKGVNIHIYGRIVAIADVFDALSFKRSYKDAWAQEDVLIFLREMSGKAFDPKLIDLFFANLEQFLDIYDMQLEKNKERNASKMKMGQIVEWLFKER